MNINSLDRFVEAQEAMYPMALDEIKKGCKCTHWIWFVFPQLRGLGYSRKSYEYGISGIDEVEAYLTHPLLSKRLYEITEALLEHKDKDINDIMGEVDAMKLKSSMTLFGLVSEKDSVFNQVLECFYGGEKDKATLRMLGL